MNAKSYRTFPTLQWLHVIEPANVFSSVSSRQRRQVQSKHLAWDRCVRRIIVDHSGWVYDVQMISPLAIGVFAMKTMFIFSSNVWRAFDMQSWENIAAMGYMALTFRLSPVWRTSKAFVSKMAATRKISSSLSFSANIVLTNVTKLARRTLYKGVFLRSFKWSSNSENFSKSRGFLVFSKRQRNGRMTQ